MTRRWTIHLQDAEMSATFDDEKAAWDHAEKYSRIELDQFSTWYLFTVVTDMDMRISMTQDWTSAIERSMRKEREFGRQLERMTAR